MRGPIRSILLAALAVCALGALTVGSASAANIKNETSAVSLQAIYGTPATNGVALPVGGGLGRNFGFGENMLFRAGNGVGTKLQIELGGVIAKARDSFLGVTLMSNHTGEGNALSATLQFSDFQDSIVNGAKVQSYSDTSDRPWITEICGVSETGHTKECKIDPQLTEAQAEGRTVKIEDVSFDIGGTIVQGTVWGTWVNGATGKVAPCITLRTRPTASSASQNLIVTQSAVFPIGTAATKVEGKACLISANNDWFSVPAEGTEPAEEEKPIITLKNE